MLWAGIGLVTDPDIPTCLLLKHRSAKTKKISDPEQAWACLECPGD